MILDLDTSLEVFGCYAQDRSFGMCQLGFLQRLSRAHMSSADTGCQADLRRRFDAFEITRPGHCSSRILKAIYIPMVRQI